MNTHPRILIVNDDPVLAKDTANRLKSMGYEVVGGVPAGEEAVRIAEVTKPDLVLMDILPGGDSGHIETAKLIADCSGSAVVYLRARADKHLLETAHRLRPYAYVQKPIMLRDVRFSTDMALLKNSMEKECDEESVRRSEQKFRNIFESFQEILLVIDAESGTILSANHAVERLLGYKARDVIGKPFSTICPSASRLLHDVHVQTSGETRPVRSSRSVLRADGSELFADMTATIIPWEDGSAVLASCRDISERICVREALKISHDRLEVRDRERTVQLAQANEELQMQIAERRRTADALRESEERFRTIVNSATDCIFIKDESGRYTLVNPAMEDILGLPSQDILGRTDEDLFGKEVAAHLKEVDSRVLGGEHIEEEHTRPVKGSLLTFLDTRVPMVAREKIVGICGISRNITDRKQQETASLPVNRDYNSVSMRSTMAAALLAAERSSTILITGESGTGKDYLARYIHDHSPQSSGPFFSINCAAVPANLAESELFGHEAGAFTGADRRKKGLLELAEGGTLVLDEIGELSPDVQAKLLSFLDTRTFNRIGGEKSVTVDARLIVATNRNLLDEVSAGRFRADLFYRLNVFSLWVPPLRERSEDLPVLVEQILQQIATELQLPGLPRIDPDTMKKMQRYRWPGNVRELRNVLERAAILAGGSRLDSDSFDLDESHDADEPMTFQVAGGQPLEEAVRNLKTFLVKQALRATGGNKTAAARILGVSRHSVINYLK